MIISGKEILKRLGSDIIIEPFSEKRVNPNSYNLTLHDELLVYDEVVLDMKRPNKFHRIKIPKEGFVLHPGELYLGRTVERTKTDNLIPMLEGRSSVGRLGVSIHVTAGFGDVGFDGFWTLEITCVKPIRIYAGVDICQIYYCEVEGDCTEYKGKYSDQKDILPSMMYKDFESQD